jgi:myo-inositol-1(or 4)-monophosphatase
VKTLVKEKEVAVKAALQAGVLLRRHLGKLQAGDVSVKKRFDFVTVIDQKSEELIVGAIRAVFPQHKFLGEETHRDERGGFRWIIDPLDGTTNYIHSVPLFAISIGLELEGEMVLGVIYDPMSKELFVAEKGRGATLNGNTIHVSEIADTEISLLGTGFPFRSQEHLDEYLISFRRLVAQSSGIRRVGAVALDFAWLAAGRFDGFWEMGLMPWDVAAGYLLVKEAGGQMTDFSGGDDPIWSGNVVASNGHLQAGMLQVVKEVFGGTVPR